MRTSIIALLLLALLASACGDGAAASGPLGDGKEVYGSICSTCHGSRGQGGTGPALDTVTETFPTCSEHIKWIALGSQGWKDTIGETYGAPSKPVAGGMPMLGESLTADQIAAAAVYERVQFGDLEEAAALADCGFTVAPSPESNPGADG